MSQRALVALLLVTSGCDDGADCGAPPMCGHWDTNETGIRDGGPGADFLTGGGGADTVDYSARFLPLVVSTNDQIGDGEPGENDNVGSDVEAVNGGSADDQLVGGPADGTLRGGGADDLLDGGGGADRLEGGDGIEQTAGAGGPG